MRFITIMLASVAFATVSYASGDHTCQGNANCSTNNYDNDTYNTTNKGGEGGKGGTGVGIGYGEGGNSSSSSAAAASANNKNDNRDTNNNTNVGVNSQGQEQGQEQSQSQTARSSSKSGVYGSGNSANVNVIDASTHNPREVASAAALYIQMAAGVCGKGFGISGQGLTVGGAISATFSDDFCEKIKLVASFEAQGNKVMVRAVLCTVDHVRDADEFLHEQGQAGYCDKPAPTPVAELAPAYQPMQPVRD